MRTAGSFGSAGCVAGILRGALLPQADPHSHRISPFLYDSLNIVPVPDNAFCEQEACRQHVIIAGRAHGYGDGWLFAFRPEPDFQGFLHRQVIEIVRQPGGGHAIDSESADGSTFTARGL